MSKISSNTYSGHAGNGGLQGHSVSDNYPWIVVGYGHPTTYRTENLITGEQLPMRATCAEAGADADRAAERSRAREHYTALAARAAVIGPAIQPDEEEAYRAISVEPHAVPKFNLFGRAALINRLMQAQVESNAFCGSNK